jgi:hypothetical protein
MRTIFFKPKTVPLATLPSAKVKHYLKFHLHFNTIRVNFLTQQTGGRLLLM